MSISLYRNKLENLKGQRDKIKIDLDTLCKKLTFIKRDARNIDIAQTILQTVAKQTQEKLIFYISDMINAALAAIYEEPYEFKLNFVLKRNKTEAEIKLVKNGEEADPMSAVGGGVVDVISFALRIALWNLQSPKSRNTIILDEPIKFLSRDLQPKASEMIKMLSKKLNLQFIIVSHDSAIIDAADKTINVKMRKGISYVT